MSNTLAQELGPFGFKPEVRTAWFILVAFSQAEPTHLNGTLPQSLVPCPALPCPAPLKPASPCAVNQSISGSAAIGKMVQSDQFSHGLCCISQEITFACFFYLVLDRHLAVLAVTA